MMNCKEVHRIVAEDLGEDRGLMQRLEMKLHLMMCGKCSRYVAQMMAIGDSIRSLCASRPEDEATVERLESSVMAGCSPHTDGKSPE